MICSINRAGDPHVHRVPSTIRGSVSRRTQQNSLSSYSMTDHIPTAVRAVWCTMTCGSQPAAIHMLLCITSCVLLLLVLTGDSECSTQHSRWQPLARPSCNCLSCFQCLSSSALFCIHSFILLHPLFHTDATAIDGAGQFGEHCQQRILSIQHSGRAEMLLKSPVE